ncbi:MAG: radical SAM protein [Candidatus Methanomethyliales bacterium]|nr:radical SAM protein [Candidatus Methanomethylicales archaeon]
MLSYRPKPAVYSVSITGHRCDLGCQHCRGKYLKGMEAVEDPDGLIRTFLKAKEKGAKNILISGGFDRLGRLPVMDFLGAISQGKSMTGLVVEIHSGLNRELGRLRDAGVDALLLDVVGEQETIERYIGGQWCAEEYAEVLREAKRFIPLVAAHILVGVDRGEIRGEFKAVDMVAEAKADALSILTPMDARSPELDEIAKVMEYARERFGDHLTLGCMRTRGKDRPEIERLAVDLGFDGIANPLRRTLRYAESTGVKVIEVEGCCVFTQDRIPMNTKGLPGARQADTKGT